MAEPMSTPLLGSDETVTAVGKENSESVPEDVILQKRQTRQKQVPVTLYAQEVAQLVARLEKKDIRDMGGVKLFRGFTEKAYRFVFAYEEKYPNVTPELKTILPSGRIENVKKKLEPKPEGAIIAYTQSQKMLDKKTAQVFENQGSPFVFQKNGEPYVMQTWPTKFNEQFRSQFTLHKYPNNPDTEHFEEEALEDFKRVGLTLFQGSDDEDPPLWLGVRASENTLPMYQGTGAQLMALLRLRQDIREQLRILKILEPDGFMSKFTTKKNEGEKPFHMDLALSYCLYTKQGWETMACVKPLHQFEWEATPYEEQQIPEDDVKEGVISFPLDMEWVSGPAYMWVWRATAVVWFGAFVTVTFAWFFYNRADWWENGPLSDFWQHLANTVTAIIILTAIFYGLYADNRAMSYCIVPWLQNVETPCKIPFYGMASCATFRYFSLASTTAQMLTIQLNAWTLGNTVRNSNCQTEQAWQWLWLEGGVGFCPLNLIHSVLVVWGLSTLQLFVPIFYTMVYISPATAPKTIAEKVQVNRDIDRHSYKSRCTSLLSDTFSEGVTLMALASGMRYTGAVSLSYPLAMIKRIKHQRIGFRVMTEKEDSQVWEQTQHGWEFRCVKELHKLYSVQVKRLWFILVFKYSLQMNVQVTLFILKGTLFDSEQFNYSAAFAELLSLGAMTLGIASELLDLRTLLLTFWDVSSSVRECLRKKKDEDEEKQNKDKASNASNNEVNDVGCNFEEDMHARHFFKDKNEIVQEEMLTFADLRFEYYRISVTTVGMVLLTAVAMWLIGYQMLKFFNFWLCPHHIWSWKNGCLELDKMQDFLEKKCQGPQ